MPNNDLQLIERRLGRQLDPAEAGTIRLLTRVSPELIALARTLEDPALSRRLLAYHVASSERPYLDLFVQEVVYGDTPPATWLQGRTLVPDFALEELLLKPAAALFAPLGESVAWRIAPEACDWEKQAPWLGAPACPQPQADYRTPIPPGTYALRNRHLETFADPAIAIRRWIAVRLGMAAALGQAAVVPSPDSWSADATIALAALRREEQEFGPPHGSIPGFRGPDSWYRH